MYYIFKDKNQTRLLLNENEAHIQLRTKTAWQRQDLIYLGATNINEEQIKSNNRKLREDAIGELIKNNDTCNNIKLKLNVAKLKKEPTELLEAELKLLESEIRISINKTDLLTEKDDNYQKAYSKIINNLQNEWLNTLEVDKTKLPRDFRSVDTKLTGSELGN